ncbi:MAG: PilW family protein [Arenimonas sp.]
MRYRASAFTAATRGMSLIELMVSILIGLLVVGSAIAIFLSNRQTSVASENVGRIQENMRTSFELLSRDIREASASPCAKALPVANVLNSGTTNWWTNWTQNGGVQGFSSTTAFPDAAFGTTAGTRLTGTDAIWLMSASNSGYSVNTHNATADSFTLNNTLATDLASGDIVIACNYIQAAVLQLSNVPTTVPTTVTYAASGTPGNCNTNLGLTSGACGSGPDYDFMALNENNPDPHATLAKLRAVRWFVGTSNDPDGGRSLFQSTMTNTGGTVTSQNQEIAKGVENMTITYLVSGATSYIAANLVTDWTAVNAVRVTLLLRGEENIGTDGNQIQRQISSTVTLRNRNL